MSTAAELRAARQAAGLSQAELARRAGTSQAAVSAYESARKEPGIVTYRRLLAACGSRLRIDPLPGRRSVKRLERAGREFAEAVALAEQLPFERRGGLRYPRLL